jgi:hypothetical protein
MIRYAFSLLFLIGQYYSATAQTTQADTVEFSLFFLGNTADPANEISESTLALLQQKLQTVDHPATLLLLGDNASSVGLPDREEAEYQVAENRLLSLLNISENFNGQVIFTPGDRDWDHGGQNGLTYILNQGNYLESQGSDQVLFLPGGGCPGPYEISLSENIILVVIDTQWFLHTGDKPLESSDCGAASVSDIVDQLEDILSRNKDKHIVVATHHPIYSYGPRGGRSPLKYHLFPFTALSDPLYIPLPLVGSLYPLYRTLGINTQDQHHYRYQILRKSLDKILDRDHALVHISSHERSLQHIRRGNNDYIVNGAFSEATYVKQHQNTQFAASKIGFGEIKFYRNGSAELLFWNSSQPDQPLHQQALLTTFSPSTQIVNQLNLDYSDSTITREANTKYLASNSKIKFYGNNYRTEWSLPTTFSYFDIGKEKGGLEVVKRGGGGQTLSLRLEAKDGRQYVLRSVDKYPERNIPPSLSSPFINTVLGEVISASHPYAALAIPPMADAIGVYHTNPKIVYIPDDPRLGQYRGTHANTLALFEERPDDDWSDAEYFGSSEDIESTPKMLKDLREDNDNEVDQHFYLKSRLFDLIIGDWDRHADQWRWSTQEKDTSDGRIFRPIPRDRDQAFFVNEGFFPSLASQNFVLPPIQGFDAEVRDVTRQWVAMVQYLDRRLLNNLSYEDWKSIVDEIQRRLTDEAIQTGVNRIPDTVFQVSGSKIIENLKQRRDDLEKYARTYYQFLSESVDVVGSDNKERFQVERLDNERTRVVVHKLSKNKERVEQKLFDRIFYTNETKEIHLYGLGDDDDFIVSGTTELGIKLRIIGGEGKDEITDRSSVNGFSKKTLVYDTPEGVTLNSGPETKKKLSRKSEVNRYDWGSFKYNYFSPLITASYNQDDGIFLGGGFLYKHQGFRKLPFASKHSLSASYAFATSAFNVAYSGEFTDVIGRSDLLVDLDFKAPNYVNNYFGLGNESVYDPDLQDIDFYRYRFKEYDVSALLKTNLTPYQYLAVGPVYRSIVVQATEDRFITDFPNNGLDPETVFDWHEYAGVRLQYELNRLNNFTPLRNSGNGGLGGALANLQQNSLPTRGVFWQVNADLLDGLNSLSPEFSQLSSSFTYLWSTRAPSVLTLAARIGGGHIFSKDFRFFQAQRLGGLTNLRGYRRTRFYGRSSFYSNLEFRLRVAQFRTYFFPVYFGVIGFNDIGRVWQDQESSQVWHHGYGGGIYLAPFNALVFSAVWGFSAEDSLPIFKLGYFF